MRILVTDGDSRAALAITRSLGQQHEVIVGATEQRSLASVSRYCRAALAYPDPARDEHGFIDALCTYTRQHGVDVLLPVTDVTTFLIAGQRVAFGPTCQVPVPDIATLLRAADKVDVIRLACQIGVPTPTSRVIRSAAEGQALASSLTFPVVIKPGRSRVQKDGRWLSTSVRYANNPDELAMRLQTLHPEVFPVMLQERIHGPGIGMFYCYDHGRPTAVFAHRRLREKPPSGGVSVLRESVPIDPQTDEYARRLLGELKWHGVAMVEFKRDERDGIPKLMEINGRFWGSLQLAIDAGMDFPVRLLHTLDGSSETGSMTGYRTGVKSRWLWGDVDALLMRLFKHEERQRMPVSQRGRLHALREFFKWQGRDCHFEVLRFSDLRPWLLESWHWLFGH